MMVLLATALLLVAGALRAGTADAATVQYWTDGSGVRAYAECNPLTYNSTVSTSNTWRLGASQNGVNSPFGAGYAPAYVKFAVYDIDRGRWLFTDANWRYIPQTIQGLAGGGLWPFGQGRFSVWVQFLHGTATKWFQAGYMRWYGGLCFNY